MDDDATRSPDPTSPAIRIRPRGDRLLRGWSPRGRSHPVGASSGLYGSDRARDAPLRGTPERAARRLATAHPPARRVGERGCAATPRPRVHRADGPSPARELEIRLRAFRIFEG